MNYFKETQRASCGPKPQLSDISAKKPLPATDTAFSRFAEQGLSSRQTGRNPVPQLSSAVYFRQAS